jgi:hypothetical protein
MGFILFFTIPPGFFVWQASPTWVRSHTPAVTAYLVIAAVVSIWGCFRSWRTALRFDGQGVMVRNAVRTYRIGWHEVRCFADGWVQRCLVPVG